MAGQTAPATEISAADAALYRDAFKAADRGRHDEAERLAKRARQQLPAKVVRWLALTSPDSTAGWEELRRFLEENPDWPNLGAIRRNAERAMPPTLSAREVAAWFAKYPPLGTAGFMRHMEALAATGQAQERARLIRAHYIRQPLGSVEERDFQRLYKDVLRPEDHWARADRLLWDGDHERARRMMRLLDRGRDKLVEARIALMTMAGGVEGAIARVPVNLRDDPGLVYERLRWRRRKDLDDRALELLENPPRDLGRPEAWWTERHILARRLIEKGQHRRAYQLVAAHGADAGMAFAQAEFLAGWLSLRFLEQPKRALAHFEALYKGVKSPLSLSRGAYWAGRAAEELGDTARARTWFEQAAVHGSTFYGLLAAERLGVPPDLAIPKDVALNKEAVARFEKQELVRLARLLHRIEGKDGRHFELFIRRLAENADDADAYEPLARLVLSLDRPDMAVTVGRRALQDGLVLVESGYPLKDGSWGKGPPQGPESALVHAIIRQESNFDRRAVSVAGARGLMQLMPATGQAVARQLGLKHSHDRLIEDPAYNVTLGSTYLGQLLERFNGSYVLAVASYNGGQGRVAGWLGTYGDPRSQSIDVIDWIELMPVYETRNYVQRVLENLQVYRARLGLPAVPLSQDLNRGSGGAG